jgi:hypothetical protein
MNVLSCEQARRLLGASRRDDWTTDELEALGAHLRACPDCRKVEAQYREVGEQVRQLPSTPPPAWFRGRVFAAIAADQQRVARRRMHAAPSRAPGHAPGYAPGRAPSWAGQSAAALAGVSRMAGAETDPSLAAVRRAPAPRSLRQRLAAVVQTDTRIVAGLAAMLLLALLGAALVPASPFFLFGGTPTITQYTADARVSHLTSTSASTEWLAYGGQDASGQYLLLAQSRQGGRPIALVTGSSSPLAVVAVTGHWVLWRASDGADWRLAASMLPSGQTSTLLDSTASGSGAPIALHGVWASGNRVLAAITTRGGSGLVVQFDLSSGAPTASIVVRAGPSFELADPSFDGGTYYWAYILQDPDGGLHSSIWRGTDASHAQQVLSDDEAFRPQVIHGTLVWVSSGSAPKTSGPEIDPGLAAARGMVQRRNLTSGQQRQIGTNAAAASLAAAGALAIWQSGAKTYTYDIGAQGPSRVDAQVRGASVVGLSDTALVWVEPSSNTTLNVYDVQ